MPLQKQLVPVDFTGGVDTKTDEKLVIPGKLLRLTNAVMRKGTPEKRPGCAALGQGTISDGVTLTSVDGLAVFRDELIRFSDERIYGYVPGSDKWVRKQGTQQDLTCTFSKENIARSSYSQWDGDHGTVANYTVFFWQEVHGSNYILYSCVTDNTTGAYVREPITETLDTTPLSVRCVTLGTIVLALYTKGSNLNALRWDSATPDDVTLVSAIKNNVATGVTNPGLGNYADVDVIAISGTLATVAYISTTGSNRNISLFNVNAAGVAQGSPTPVVINAAAPYAQVHLARYASGSLALCYSRENPNNGFYALTLNSSFSVTAGPVTLHASLEFGKHRVSLGTADGVNMRVMVTDATQIYGASFIAALTGSPTLGLVGRDIRIVSGLFVLNSELYYAVEVAGGVDPTMAVIRAETGLEGIPIARFLPSQTAVTGGFRAARPVVTANGEISLLGSERGRLAYSTIGSTVIDQTTAGIVRFRLKQADPSEVARTYFAGALLISGAHPRTYDGAMRVGAGIDFSPRLSASAAASGGLSAGTYQVCGVFERLDSKGRRTLSPAGTPVPVVVAAGEKITGFILPLPFNDPLITAVHIFSTTANGTIFHRASSVTAPTPTSPTALTAYTVDLSDAQLLVREILYTTGGVLDVTAPPAHHFSHIHRRRLFLGGCEDPYSIPYSFEEVPGEAAGFNPILELRVPEGKGRPTGIGSIDDKVIIFCQRGIFVVIGDGPDLLGQQNSFTLPEPLATDVGCIDWRSVVSVPQGLLFQSHRGFHLLNRGLQVEYVGADVEAWNTWSCVRATQLDSQRQVRFQMKHPSGGTNIALVFDYERGQWDVFTPYDATDALVWNGVYVRTDGTNIFREDETLYQDAGVSYSWGLKTSWLKVAGVQGYQRAYRALFLGSYASPASVNLKVYTDYEATEVESKTAAFDGTTQPGTVFQARHHLKNQQCQSVAFEMEISGTGKTIALTNMTLEVGLKRGPKKLNSDKRTI